VFCADNADTKQRGLTVGKKNLHSMIRKLTLTYLLLIPNQSADRKKTEIIFSSFFENYFLFPFLYCTFARHKTSSYNNKQDNKHYVTEVVGDEVILLDKKTD
jgi:hypothetical protein